MGGLTSSPPSPPAPVYEQPAVDPTVEAERKARLEGIERRRRGRAATIKTSERGLMGTTSIKPTKELLGE
ncbi:hypothetical protein V5T82_11000 [Magnetovibrio sp. PR-2]|uniref:hypothetical protein n=1 Tax=Magnetovibrio sp. PR-2 TaxID=3120356 RepID=UPI002FCE36A0